MSRIGRKIIPLPKGVSISVDNSNVVTVKGPKGELKHEVHPDITVSVEADGIQLNRPTDQKRHKAMHGLYRTIVNNLVVGVAEGYSKNMELVGVGYKAEAAGNQLELSLGFSHPIVFILPKEIGVKTETLRGQNPKIFLSGIDKQLLGQVAAKIRSLRPPEPYKGKGIRYIGEEIRRKAGKTGGKKK
ncbi:MAG: 50S ribosomal protein L6 [Bacteroidia bacterium]